MKMTCNVCKTNKVMCNDCMNKFVKLVVGLIILSDGVVREMIADDNFDIIGFPYY